MHRTQHSLGVGKFGIKQDQYEDFFIDWQKKVK